MIILFPEVFSAMNIFMSLLLKYSYHTMFYNFQFMILAILATHMHLHLWQTDRHPHGSSTLMSIPMSEMPSVNSTA
ncbi:hypothetical protein C8R48DRAFT_780265 [Suillus tomentosus]|nr:hypothetical protein C8R48DRAFT_780265 [Suillus tomentosus]